MSILWRFNMIPDIGQSLRVSPILIGGRIKSAPNIVVVSITSDDLQDAEVHMQVFSSPGMVSELSTPVDTRTVTIRNGLSEFLLTSLPRGSYAGLAYVDVNTNGQIDLADDGSPAEPFGFAKVSSPAEAQSVANGVFDVSGDPTFIKIHLIRPKFPVAPSRPPEDVN